MNRSIIAAAATGLTFVVLGMGAICQFNETRADVAVAKSGKTTIVCQFAVRPSSRVAKFDKKDIVIEVPVTDGPVPDIGRSTPPKTHEFDNFRVEVQGMMNALYVRVYDKTNKRLICSQLFQFGTKLHNQFHGGHGFTGLNYVHHPKSESELQFWCKVK